MGSMVRVWSVLLLALGLVRCAGSSGAPVAAAEAPGADARVVDAWPADVVPTVDVVVDTVRSLDDPSGAPADAGSDSEGDSTNADTGSLPQTPWGPPDDTLHARVARADFPIPLGISTAGYSQSGVEGWSPFVGHFTPTRVLHTSPGVKVLVLHAGGRRVVVARVDLIGVFGGMFRAVAARVQERLGADISEELVLAATHTHAGPARFVPHPLNEVVADSFDPAIYEAIVATIAGAITEALSLEAEPAALGHAITTNDALHHDRRCENPPLEDGTLGVLRVDRLDGTALALVVSYALHGTVLDHAAQMLSTDAPGAVELGVEEQLPSATVLFLQSWGGDMAPSNLTEQFPQRGPVTEIPDGLTRLDALGRVAADAILETVDSLSTTRDPLLEHAGAWAPLGLEEIGYAPGEWPHPNGAMFCGGGMSPCADGIAQLTMGSCFDLPLPMALRETRVGALRIGDLVLVTLPGEPVTSLGLGLRDAVRDATGLDDVLIVGYANDYTGYLLDPEDWAQGGYEAGFSFWGPRQGAHLAGWAAAVAERLVEPGAALPSPEAAPPELPVAAPEGPSATPSVSHGAIVAQPSQVQAPAPVEFSWTGGDPAIDHPRVVLERRGADGVFAPTGVTEQGYHLLLSVTPEPPYAKGIAVPARTFVWTASLATARRVPTTLTLDGELRLRVTGRALAGDVLPYDLSSEPFTVVSAPGDR